MRSLTAGSSANVSFLSVQYTRHGNQVGKSITKPKLEELVADMAKEWNTRDAKRATQESDWRTDDNRTGWLRPRTLRRKCRLMMRMAKQPGPVDAKESDLPKEWMATVEMDLSHETDVDCYPKGK